MKSITTILAVFILFMTITSAMPVRNESVSKDSCQKSCCDTKKENHTGKSNTNSCCKSMCNPFMSCCGFCSLTTYLTFDFSTVLLSQNKFYDFADKLFVIYLSSAWNPPQMV